MTRTGDPITQCRVCNSVAGHKPFKAREMMFGLMDKFDYFECSDCGSLQIYSEPINLTRYYSGTYYSFARDAAWVSYLKRAWAQFSIGRPNLLGKLIAKAIGVHQGVRALSKSRVTASAKILDVGCGSGELIQLLSGLGYPHLTGVDPFLGGDTVVSGFQLLKRQLKEVEGAYDLIMFNHSLEHTFSPVELLTKAASLLTNNGKVIIRIPIAGNFAWREFGSDWVGLDAPRHLCIPSRSGLIRMASSSNLALEDIYYESDEFMFWASEQYRNNIPLHSHLSHTSSILKRILPNRKMRAFRRRAEQLNSIEDSDTVCAFFTKKQLT